MSTYVDSLIDRYRTKGILIDANLALLYLVGGYDLRLVGDGKYNKLSKYDAEAVSYTHLDVYKRQRQSFCAWSPDR